MVVEDGNSTSTDGKQKTHAHTTYELFQAFLEESTIHGLQKLHDSQTKRRKTLWTVAMILISIWVCAHFGILLNSFLSNDTSIDVRIVDTRLLEFPAVTICNANPIKKSALVALAAKDVRLQQLLALEDSDTGKRRRRRETVWLVDTWTPYGDQGMEYYLCTQMVEYSKAKAICESNSAKMAKIVSRTMAVEILNAFETTYLTDLQYIEQDAAFRHSDGSEPMWAEWADGEPDKTFLVYGLVRVLAYCAYFTEEGLKDIYCTAPLKFVCERKRTESSPATVTPATVAPPSKQTTASEMKYRMTSALVYKPTTTASASTSASRKEYYSSAAGHQHSTDATTDWTTSAPEQYLQPSTDIYTSVTRTASVATPDEKETSLLCNSTSAINSSILVPASANSDATTVTSSLARRTSESLIITTEEKTAERTSTEPHFTTTNLLTENVDRCSSSPCKHGGTCIDEENGYVCMCTDHFQGLRCEMALVEEGGEDLAFKKAEAVTKILSSLDDEARTSIGYQVNDLLFFCRYNGRLCNISRDFQQMSNPTFGNCYTFNSKWQTSTTSRYLTTMSGRRHGLEIGIYLGQNDIFKAAGAIAGAVVVIHSKDTMPFPEDYGTVLPPGVYNAVRIHKIQIKRLPFPYGDCILANSDMSDRDVYTSQYNVTYSKTGCQRTCHQRRVIETCLCALPNYPRFGIPFGDNNISLCDESNEQEEQDLADDKLKCDCPNACHEDIYVASTSSSRWPTTKRMNDAVLDMKKLYPDIFSGHNKNNDPNVDSKIIKENFLKAAIFYDDLSHERISEVPMYTNFQFAGDVGGMLGLWIGLSSLGVVQLIEFVLVAVYTKTVKILHSRRRVTDSHIAAH